MNYPICQRLLPDRYSVIDSPPLVANFAGVALTRRVTVIAHPTSKNWQLMGVQMIVGCSTQGYHLKSRSAICSYPSPTIIWQAFTQQAAFPPLAGVSRTLEQKCHLVTFA
ncbi:MAG TPA: hypothetical protein V6D30_13975 [Leptolyngbyaceae cyanobacterium]